MLLKAHHHFLIYPFFKFYAGWIIKRHFGQVQVVENYVDKGSSVVLLANHFSWWDGFFAMYLNVNVLKRKFHFMMLEEQLKKFSFFNQTGGFSVRKNSRSLLESINYTVELLSEKQNMVLLFPQGKIETSYKNEFQFEAGIGRILSHVKAPVQILFMVNLIDYYSSRKPGIYMHVSEYTGDKLDAQSLTQAYNLFYHECVQTNALKHQDQ